MVSLFVILLIFVVLFTGVLPVIIADHAHFPGIAALCCVLASGGSLRPSKLFIAFLTEAFGIMLAVYMGAFGYASRRFSRILLGYIFYLDITGDGSHRVYPQGFFR